MALPSIEWMTTYIADVWKSSGYKNKDQFDTWLYSLRSGFGYDFAHPGFDFSKSGFYLGSNSGWYVGENQTGFNNRWVKKEQFDLNKGVDQIRVTVYGLDNGKSVFDSGWQTVKAGKTSAEVWVNLYADWGKVQSGYRTEVTFKDVDTGATDRDSKIEYFVKQPPTVSIESLMRGTEGVSATERVWLNAEGHTLTVKGRSNAPAGVEVFLKNGNQIIGTGVVNADGTFEVVFNGTGTQDGIYNFSVTVGRGEAAGTSTNLSVGVDTKGAYLHMDPEVMYFDDAGQAVGSGFMTAPTDAHSIKVKGTVAEMSGDIKAIDVYLNGVMVGQAQVDGKNWSYQFNGLPEGHNEWKLVTTDQAGNQVTYQGPAALSVFDTLPEFVWSEQSGYGDVNAQGAVERLLGYTIPTVPDTMYHSGDLVSLDQVQGVPSVKHAGFDGSGVKVAIIDTGITWDVADTYLGSRFDPKSIDVDTGVAITTDDDPLGHGTKVVTSAFADTVGQAYEAKFNGIATGSDVLVLRGSVQKGIVYAVDQGAEVVSISVDDFNGNPFNDPRMTDAFSYAHDHGVIITIAAGNYGYSDSHLIEIAQFAKLYDNVITVGASTFDANGNKQLAGFSSPAGTTSPFNFVTFTGENVAAIGKDGALYATSGTSISAPATAAVVALAIDAVNGSDGTQAYNYHNVVDALLYTAHQYVVI